MPGPLKSCCPRQNSGTRRAPKAGLRGGIGRASSVSCRYAGDHRARLEGQEREAGVFVEKKSVDGRAAGLEKGGRAEGSAEGDRGSSRGKPIPWRSRSTIAPPYFLKRNGRF